MRFITRKLLPKRFKILDSKAFDKCLEKSTNNAQKVLKIFLKNLLLFAKYIEYKLNLMENLVRIIESYGSFENCTFCR